MAQPTVSTDQMEDPAPERSSRERAHLEEVAANTIRGLTIDAVEKANSGHPGLPMGMADAATVLWTRFLKHNPEDPQWFDRDRFVLSAGHGSMLIYSLLHLSGYDVSLEDLKEFRQLHSKTPGHPEVHHTPGVETTTGPLGQGLATAVGMAIAEKHLAAAFNTADHVVVGHYTYVIASDGDLQEGVTNEASSLAGHLGLGRLVVLYDDNHVSIDGDTQLSFTEDRAGRYEALGWHVIREIDGHDNEAVARAIREARNVLDRPSFLEVRTTIGYGSPNLAGQHTVHSDAIGDEEIEATKKNLGIPLEPDFYVPDDATALFHEQAARGAREQHEWEGRLTAYAEAQPDQAADLRRRIEGRLPDGWTDALPTFDADEKGMASRAASGKVLDALVPVLPELVGGSADLTPSVKTKAKGMQDFQKTTAEARYVHYGIREHAMAAAMNGMALHGGVRPYGGTFLIFSDYMKPAVRLGALMEAPVVHVFTHDSVGLGEDGPTHQPIEQLAGLRATPGLHVVRPADANETAAAWKLAVESPGPTALALSRQALPTFAESKDRAVDGVARGGYVLSDADGEPDLILVGAGAEVNLLMEAKKELGGAVRVVSMPCDRLFFQQDEAYRESVLPSSVRARVAVEAASPYGWGRVVGLDGEVIAIDRFGESAPGADALTDLGLTVEAVVEAARRVRS
ncbi:transketolase [Rubrivirga sp. S365]|nr:transketolase [Rubrivirga sp. S365]MDT7855865.1 transketolase [Rubrivirga sp. S365]